MPAPLANQVEQVGYNLKMKIQLAPLYANLWRSGYLQTSAEGRKYLVLFNSNKDRTISSYARYVLAVKIGRLLTEDEEADHIDEDRTNDAPDNLQLLSSKDNKIKNNLFRKSIRVPVHGTLTEYRYCKCVLCKKAKSDHSKAASAAKKLSADLAQPGRATVL